MLKFKQLLGNVFILFCLFSCPMINAQNSAKVSITSGQKYLKDLIKEIENQTDYTFVFDNSISLSQVFLLEGGKEDIKVLLQVIEKEGISCEIVGKQIVLRKEAMLSKNSKKIKGVVVDETGEAIIGASVRIKGSSLGTITDIEGKFNIEISPNSTLEFTYIGYNSKSVLVGNTRELTIVLHENIKELNEVVVVGYGTQKKTSLTGAIASIDSKILESRSFQNIANALQGEIPGVSILRNSGAVGATADIKIRDLSSVNGGSPLVLIDGMENSLSSINPNDIETLTVLKDGSAAIYGSRAADGVILITTKSGNRNQKTTVSADLYYALKTPSTMKRTVNLLQYAEMGLEITDGSWTSEYTKDDLPLIAANSDKVVENGIWGAYPKLYQYHDWKKSLIGNGHLQSYNVNISGGANSYNYMVSAGYQNETGLPKFGVEKEDRYFLRAKNNIDIVKNVSLDINIAYEMFNGTTPMYNHTGVDGLWFRLFTSRAWAPLLNPQGDFYTFQNYENPAQALEKGGNKTWKRSNTSLNSKFTWKLIDGLNIVGQAALRINQGNGSSFQKTFYGLDYYGNNHMTKWAPNYASLSNEYTLYKNFSAFIEYKKQLNPIHFVGAMVGTAHESSDYDYMYAARKDFNQEELPSLNLGSSENQESSSSGSAWTINSVFARLNYSILDKYLVEANFRADASSRFHPNYRWGYFPNVSVGWRLTEEKFIKDLNIFDNLKIRGSFGLTGNQSGIGLYDYRQLINISNSYYPFGDGNKGMIASQGGMVSLNRTWENIQMLNGGIDFSLLNNRLTGSFDAFYKVNKNMLIPVIYPSVLGSVAPSTNNGRLEVRGWELNIGWRDKIGDFSYFINANVSDARNIVVRKGGKDVFNLGWNSTREGYSTQSYFGYSFDGIIQNQEELDAYKSRFKNGGIPNVRIGDAMYKDLDGDGQLSQYGNGEKGQGDVIHLGDANPRYNFGIKLGFEYKGFDFSLTGQGTGKRVIFLDNEASRPFYYWWFDPLEYWYGKTWTAERIDAKYPAITIDGSRGWYNYAPSENTKFTTAYFRLKNIQLGYSLPKSLIAKLHVEKVRIYLSGEDMFEVHSMPGGYNPEDGGGYSNYPFTRLFSIGFNLTF